MSKDIKYFILTGDPGVGKTTLIKKLWTFIKERGVITTGFVTEEVRQNRIREGFDIVSLDGTRSRLARDQNLLPVPAKFTVGKYGVLIQEFDKVAIPSLNIKQIDGISSCYIIDEIGKMEFFSSLFKCRIKEIFSSDNFVLATIPIRKSDNLIESIRNSSKSKVWTITRENRNIIHKEILNEMQTSMNIILSI